jgi:tetratricopeptide (TPR) repeat protein
MKKAIFASMLAAAAIAAAPYSAAAQAAAQPAAGGQAPAAGQAAGGQVQLSPPEFDAYNKVQTAADPASKVTAAEAFLQQFPQSSVKSAVLQQLAVAYYSQQNWAKAADAADRLLQADPNNIQGLFIATSAAKSQGDTATDAGTRQPAYDKAAGYATRGLAATKPASVDQTQWDTVTKQLAPIFYSAIGIDAMGKKDYAGAISAYSSELKAVPEDQTKQPGPILQDTYYLGTAYYQSTPPDYLSCTFYATRAVTYAPDQFKAQFQPVATYCYKKYHGGDDGYDAVKTAAAASVTMPDSLKTSIKPAPTPADQATTVLASDKQDDPTLAKTNLADRMFVIQYGTADQAEQEFTPIKGKEAKLSGVVVSIDGTDLKLAVTDDAKAANPKTADVEVTLKEAPKTTPAVDATVEVVGTFDSYTQQPLLVKMTGGEIQAKAAARTAPARRAPARRR